MKNSQPIRARFAPSPTGYLHVGGLRTALYTYLLARQGQGQFILRIEDTDQTREAPGAIENILTSLNWAGLAPDEGVILKQGKIDERGKLGPYIQSKRQKIYQKYAQELIKKGQAYYCFCSTKRLETLKKQQEAAKQPTRYDWHCRDLTEQEVKNKLSRGEKYVIRLKAPTNQILEFTDWVYGKIVFNTNEIDDQVLLKSDGLPTYHLAVVIDDHLMKISHVIRGEEWLPSTPKHLLLYLFFGWEAPQFIHLPLILNPDKSKLSKRQGDVAVEDYRQKGYLAEALINFVALLGWNPGTDQEIFSLPELIKQFNPDKIHKAGAVFDLIKLNWLNGVYLKKMSLVDFQKVAEPFLKANFKKIPTDLQLKKIYELEQSRISVLNEMGQGLTFCFTEKLNYPASLLIWKKSSSTLIKNNLQLLLAELKKYTARDWTEKKLEEKIFAFIKNNNLNNGETLWPLRVALSGQEKSAPPFALAEALGQKRTLISLTEAIKKLG